MVGRRYDTRNLNDELIGLSSGFSNLQLLQCKLFLVMDLQEHPSFPEVLAAVVAIAVEPVIQEIQLLMVKLFSISEPDSPTSWFLQLLPLN